VSGDTGQHCAVLLDIDGTLIESTYHHAVAWHRAFARHGLHPGMHTIHRTIGMGGDKLVAEVAGDDVEERLGDALRDAWREEYLPLREEVGPLAGARELVQELHAAGHRVALASSGDPQFSAEAVDLLDVGEAIELLTTSEDVDASKPAPDLLDVTLEKLGRPGRAVLVGDTIYDVASAARAGMPCVGLLSGGFGRAELADARAVLVVEGPGDLLGIDWERYVDAG
jgi:HAD superfamily hydrolase (TIGR01549 family)